MAFNQVWTTHNLSDLNEEKDVAYHDEAISKNMGLVHKNGSVCRMVSRVLLRTESPRPVLLLECEADRCCLPGRFRT